MINLKHQNIKTAIITLPAICTVLRERNFHERNFLIEWRVVNFYLLTNMELIADAAATASPIKDDSPNVPKPMSLTRSASTGSTQLNNLQFYSNRGAVGVPK